MVQWITYGVKEAMKEAVKEPVKTEEDSRIATGQSLPYEPSQIPKQGAEY